MTLPDALDQLVDHGLLEIVQQDRYTLHQTIHAFAAARATPDVTPFIRYFETFLAAADAERINAEVVNLLAVLDSAAEQGHVEPLLTITVQLLEWLEQRGRYETARQLIERGLRLGDQKRDAQQLATLHYRLGRISQMQDRYDETDHHWEKGMQLARQANDDDLLLVILTSVAERIGQIGRLDEARQLLEEGLALAVDVEQPEKIVRLLGGFGRTASIAEDYKQARYLLHRSVDRLSRASA